MWRDNPPVGGSQVRPDWCCEGIILTFSLLRSGENRIQGTAGEHWRWLPDQVENKFIKLSRILTELLIRLIKL